MNVNTETIGTVYITMYVKSLFALFIEIDLEPSAESN